MKLNFFIEEGMNNCIATLKRKRDERYKIAFKDPKQKNCRLEVSLESHEKKIYQNLSQNLFFFLNFVLVE